jgi:primosomal protein N' (replication factor Y)
MPEIPENVEVAIPLPLEQTFCYRVPESMKDAAVSGTRVLVPFGKRTVTGYIIGRAENGFTGDTREIIELLDREPLFTRHHIDFYRWIASYYLHPLGEVIKTALPAGLTVMGRRRSAVAADGSVVSEELLSRKIQRKEEDYYTPSATAPTLDLKGKAIDIFQVLLQRGGASATVLKEALGPCRPQLQRLVALGLVTSEKREQYRSPFRDDHPPKDAPHLLNNEQQAALQRFCAAADAGSFSPFVLHGITGSGKTEVYLQTIAYVLGQGRTALVLVPEIALTPQLVRRFRRRFPCGIAVLHSRLSVGERYDEWRRINRGEATIVIGARSAIFAPLGNVGVIVVDEEHEATYKQTEGLRYNARDLAMVLGQKSSAVVILGSATPLVTTIHASREGKIGEVVLSRRVNDRPLPETSLLDLRGRKSTLLSDELTAALAGNLAGGGQSLLFLNRRGFATWLVCRDCGHTLNCPNCSVTLTYHQQKGRHICHYCDYSIPAPSLCPACGGGDIGLLGAGTEKLEEEVTNLFPDARVARMDRDTTGGREGHSRILKRVSKGEIDILIGTQMIAKGHDFPGVTLVGVISPDTTLNLPDFRGSERAFQLVSQVLGRAGRGDSPGRVLVQTLNPGHFALRAAVEHDYEAFYREELAQRLDAGYPPFSHLAALHFSGNSPGRVETEARTTADVLRRIKKETALNMEILGPAPALLGRIRGRYRWHILLKAAKRSSLRSALIQMKHQRVADVTVRTAIDIDPLEMI